MTLKNFQKKENSAMDWKKSLKKFVESKKGKHEFVHDLTWKIRPSLIHT